MSAFHEQLKRDVDAVWFNPDEFGEPHTVDGRRMRAIIDSQAIQQRDQRRSEQYVQGVYTDSVVLFVPVAEFGAKPRIGVTLLLDNRRSYRVENVRTEDGIYAIELEAVR